jgi:hypothetical protein
MADFVMSTYSAWWDQEFWPGKQDTWWGGLSPFLDRLEKRKPGNGYSHFVTNAVSGKSDYIRIKVKVSPAQSVGWGSETGALPAAINPTIDEGYEATRNFYGRIRLSDKVMAMGSTHVIVSAVDGQMQDLEDMRRARYAKLIFGQGDGALGYVHEQNSSATCTDLDVVDAFGLKVGMEIDVLDASDSDAELAADVTITAISGVDSSYQNIAIDSSAFDGTNSDYGDKIVEANSASLAMMGLDGVMNASNPARRSLVTGLPAGYFNINRSTATKAYWKGNTIAVGGDLTEDSILQAVQICVKCDYRPTALLATQAVERYIFDELSGYRQFDKNVESTGMVEHPVFNFSGCSIALIIDPNCTRISSSGTLTEYAYLVNEDMIYIASVNDGKQWLNRGGNMFHIVNDASNMYPVWEAGFAEYLEVVCPNPSKAGVKLTGITS